MLDGKIASMPPRPAVNVLDEVYAIYPDYLINKMNDDEKDNIKCEFKTSLYTDMTITIDDVFKGRF